MKLSQFVFKTEINEQECVLFNTINYGIVKLKKDNINKIINNKDNVDNLNQDLKKYYNQLVEMEFLIPDDVKERENYLYSLYENWKENDSMAIHILTTTGCNFACKYCYQSGINRDERLTTKDVSKIIEYLNIYFSENENISHINVILHGGEPTCNWEPVEILLKKINNLCIKFNISYHTQIVSNGYLLDKKKVDLLANHNWNRAQLTLDGLADIHNQRRPLKSEGGSFKTIIKNINYMLNNNKIDNIDLRINYDKNNIDYIEELLEFIRRKFDTKKINLTFGWVSNTIKGTNSAEYFNKYGLEIKDISKTYSFLYSVAYKKGFKMQYFYTFDAMCTAKQKHSCVISPSGNIYKCLSMVGRESGIVSHINDLKTDLPNYFFKDLYKKCFDKKCEFIPICHTGCRFETYLKTGKIRNIDTCRYKEMKDINKNIFGILYD